MKASQHHPDKGGDPEKFKMLVRAYSVLFDEEKRARYDAGESEESISKATITEDQEILTLLTNLFVQAVASSNPDKQNPITLIQGSIRHSMDQFKNSLAKEEQMIRKFESALKRFKTKNPENIFVSAATAQIANHKRTIENCEKQLRIGGGALKFLNAYDYEIDQDVVSVFLNPTFTISIDPGFFQEKGR